MNNEKHTTTAAKLRHTAASIATDIANAPLKNRHHEALVRLNAHFLTLEKSMLSTSDSLSSTVSSAQDLVAAFSRLRIASHNTRSLRSSLGHSLAHLSGQGRPRDATSNTSDGGQQRHTQVNRGAFVNPTPLGSSSSLDVVSRGEMTLESDGEPNVSENVVITEDLSLP